MAFQRKIRRAQARQRRVRTTGSIWSRVFQAVVSWPTLVGVIFSLSACAIALVGAGGLNYLVGQRIDQPVFARVDFQVEDVKGTEDAREAGLSAVPSYFTYNKKELTSEKIRSGLMRLYGVAADAETFLDYQASLKESGWPADQNAYDRLRQWIELPNDAGRIEFERLVETMPIEQEYIVRDLQREPRTPKSTKDYIILQTVNATNQVEFKELPLSEVIPHGNEKILQGTGAELARRFPPELQPTVKSIVLATLKEQPTIIFDQAKTLAAMAEAEKNVAPSYTRFQKGKPYIPPGALSPEQYEWMKAERAAHAEFLAQNSAEALRARRQELLRHVGLGALVILLSVGFISYAASFQPRIFQTKGHSIVFLLLGVGALGLARLLGSFGSQVPGLIYTPFLLLTYVFAIVYSQRFALGASCIASLLVVATVQGSFGFLVPLLVGATVIVHQLDEVRARTKLISVGLLSSLAIFLCSVAVGFRNGNEWNMVLQQGLWSAACALLSAFLISGLLPFVEKLFRTATALTLLEWRDPTRPLLQLLAREAPGTYAHSLVLGTMAEAACEKIGANALLAQVGALYHDIGKIPKAQYFTENQDGRINRHENLAPTMSLLIILGHVKDGLELAREFKLPRILHQFIEEHHGTTVVRYFHHVATEKQAQIATGRHDREVSESEFRYPGPTPRTRESAVLMLCDGVEGAVRALGEQTPGRIESVVHQIVADRLNDGQFDECDITLHEIRQVEESLVKSLIGIYHGRVAYPRARQAEEAMPKVSRSGVTVAG